MIASSIKISDEVINSNKLTMKRKRILRQEAIMKLIDSLPVGTPITLKQFSEVARIERSGNMHVFINAMLRDKIIGRYETDKKSTYAYAVLRNAKTTKKADPKPEADKPSAPTPTQQPVVDSSFEKLEELAKSFAWETNSDSVREFIVYAKGRL